MYRILGSLQLDSDGSQAELGPPKQRAVLAVLLLHAGETVPTERLIDLVWGEHPPRTAAHSIQIYVSDLRRSLEAVPGAGAIVTRPPGYALEVDPQAVDARRFERLAGEGRRLLAAGDPSGGARALRATLALWRGPPLSDFAYEEFAQPEIRRLEELRRSVVGDLAGAELAAGRADEALELVRPVLAEEPLDEGLRELEMTALYRTGRHGEALRAFQRHRAMLAELGLDPSPGLCRLQERILVHDPSLSPGPAAGVPGTPVPARNPYKGLRPFGEDDAADFFGREALVRRLLDALAAGSRLVAVVGPSGCGKSSALAAGLIPAVRAGALPASDRWPVATLIPGGHPFEELAAALARTGGPRPGAPRDPPPRDGPALVRAAAALAPEGAELLVVIDQFEELFLAAERSTVERFLQALAEAVAEPGGRVRVALALRADFYDRPLLHGAFAGVLVPGVVNVLPMTPGELEAAVTGPAGRVGVAVEPALLAELVSDTAGEPGALPLLQYTLTELFEHRDGAGLTLGAYGAIGGLRGALARRSEEAFAELDGERRRAARQVFLRLVRLGRGTRDSRRRVPVGELAALPIDPVALSDVLGAFGRRRLLAFDRDPATGEATVEVAHEALLWEWDRLAGWVDRHRADLRRHEALTAGIEEWEAAGRDPDYLPAGTRLGEYETWSREAAMELTAGEREFLQAAGERARSEHARTAATEDHRRRLERRARTRLVALISAVALLTGAVTYGVVDRVVMRPPDVALVFEGYGDAGWNDMIAAGFDRAVSRLGLRAQRVITHLGAHEAEEMVGQVRRLSDEGVGLIVVGPGTLDQAGLEAVAANHPDTRYVAVDLQGTLRNVAYASFAEQQGSFLAGAAAALRSRTGIIGFVGGIEMPVIWRCQAGYEAGARWVRPDVRVLSTYLSDNDFATAFADPPAGARAAAGLFRRGADVVYQAAGNSGIGVISAAHTQSAALGRRLWAIGIDTDQYRSLAVAVGTEAAARWRGHVLTSMVKRCDTAVADLIADYERGRFRPGVHTFGLAQGGLDLAYSGGFIEDLRPRLERLRAQIVAGQIVVPTLPDGAGSASLG